MSADRRRTPPHTRALPTAGRPDDCECDMLDPGRTPCWPCYQAGFRAAGRGAE